MESRTKSSFKNAIYSMAGYTLTILCSFAIRTVFIHILSTEYLGINGLFSSILNILSLAELGISNAIIFRLYKPILEKDELKICELMNFYKKAYYIIAIVVATLGVLLIPFLEYLIKERPDIPEALYQIYLLYLVNSVLSYLFIFKKSLIMGYQNEYITSIVSYIGTIFLTVGQILILVLTQNFLLYLSVQIIVTVSSNIINSVICDRLFPFIKNNKSFLPKEESRSILKDLSALVIYKVSGVVVTGTGNLIISKFIGLVTVGLYSNYILIVSAIYMFIKKGIESMTASIGNLNATHNVKEQENIYYTINFMAFWLYGQIAICLYVLLNPFITIWLGDNYLLPKLVVAVVAFNFYLQGITGVYAIYRNTFGLFVQGKYRPLFSVLINLIASIFLVFKFGLVGVLAGTTISYVTTYIWYDPYVVHKHIFKKSTLPFYWTQIKYIIVLLLSTLIASKVSYLIVIKSNIFDWIIDVLITLVVVNILVVICFSRTAEFNRLLSNARLLKKAI